MAFKFSRISETNLRGVHPDLVNVTRRALELTKIDFRVTEGVRNLERQKMLVRNGKSKTLDSRHLPKAFLINGEEKYYGCAIDIVAMPNANISWEWKYYQQIALAMKRAARELKIPIEWGGDWRTFKDGCHFQLPKAAY